LTPARTVLILELAGLPPKLQHLLLGYCDDREGTNPVSFRVVATSTYSPEAMDNLGSVSSELLYLLKANLLYIPSLRRRKEDILPLAADMLLRYRAQVPDCPSGFSRDVVKVLQSHEWPGNLWELKGEVWQMATAARGRQEVSIQDVARQVLVRTRSKAAERDTERQLTLPEAVENLEKSMLLEALRTTRWNRSHTARMLGISRRNLIRKITRYQLDRRKREGIEK